MSRWRRLGLFGPIEHGHERQIQADAEAVKAASRNPNLRLYTVKLKASPEPLSNQKDLAHLTRWVEAGPDTVETFSAVAYHFGAYLQKHLAGDVPIGLIQTAWGGTPGEAWTSKVALNAVPELRHYHDQLPAAIQSFDPAKAEANYKGRWRSGRPPRRKRRQKESRSLASPSRSSTPRFLRVRPAPSSTP